MKKKIKRILGIAVLICLMITGSTYFYFSDYYHADETAEKAIKTDYTVKVEDETDWIAFIPKKYDTGIILYPGAKVESEAYAPLFREFAKDGILAVVVKMPLHFALLRQNAADAVREKYDCAHWYMAGHSLGGVVASNYISEHTNEYEGIIMLASYTTKDLSRTDLKYFSIYGDQDQVLNHKSYEKNLKNIPEDKGYEYVIQGGNHAQFGSYGKQKGDGTATILPEEQWCITVAEAEDFMKVG